MIITTQGIHVCLSCLFIYLSIFSNLALALSESQRFLGHEAGITLDAWPVTAAHHAHTFTHLLTPGRNSIHLPTCFLEETTSQRKPT